MVTPKRAWSHLFHSSRRFAPSALRLVVIGALLFSAFQLHERASELEQRERSLEQRIGALSGQSDKRGDQAGQIEGVPPFLESVPETATVESSQFVDGVVHRADYREIERPIASPDPNE